MVSSIDAHRAAHGVEPICKVLPIAPSTYYDRLAKRADPARLSDRARCDEALRPEIRRVFEENWQVYGVRKVWRQLLREEIDVARCTVARLMKDMGLIHHSDRGSQYLSIRYTERLGEAGIEPSVGSVGDSYDNALAETINGLFKAEVIHRRGPWRNFEAVEYATLEWVNWFNNRRLLEPIGNIPPAEAETNSYAALDADAVAA
jgi:transposase InsO family protein